MVLHHDASPQSSSWCTGRGSAFWSLWPQILALHLATMGPSWCCSAEMVWERSTSYPGPGRHHPVTFANETHAFLLSGTTATSFGTADFYMYEEATDSWTDLTSSVPFPGTPFTYGYGVILPEPGHTKAYLGLGVAADGIVLQNRHWWEFDMAFQTWTMLADFPGPGRKHPAMIPVFLESENRWEIHVGLGDDSTQNFKDWWSYDLSSNTWQARPDFPGTARHHPFYFALGNDCYTGLGHRDSTGGSNPSIEKDWYKFNTRDATWYREADFASYAWTDFNNTTTSATPVTTEARVAGTQFAIELPLRNDSNAGNLSGAWGFVLSGDGDDHRTMPTGEFHAWGGSLSSLGRRWYQLPHHPGPSRWAPGSWIMRGTARAYFTSGYDRSTDTLYADVWRIDLSDLFTTRTNAGNTSTVGTSNLPEQVEVGGTGTGTAFSAAVSSSTTSLTLVTSLVFGLVCFHL